MTTGWRIFWQRPHVVRVSPTPPETRRKRISRWFPPVSGSQGPLNRPRLLFDDAPANEVEVSPAADSRAAASAQEGGRLGGSSPITSFGRHETRNPLPLSPFDAPCFVVLGDYVRVWLDL
jgi:hypothetical protein